VTAPELSLLLDRARESRRQGRLSEAIALFEDALRQRPDSPRGHAGYAFTLVKVGRIEDAIQAYREALRLRADFPKAWSGLGDAYQAAGCLELAIEAFENANCLNGSGDPDDARVYLLNMDPARTPEFVYEAHAAWGRRQAVPCLAPHANDATGDRILRVGYVSAFFSCHTTYSFFWPLLAEHDRTVVYVTCYDSTAKPDECSARLRCSADGWRPIHGMPDDQAAALIRQDAIDILVDLSGHTGGNRLPLFALKPAPVQVTYLGYPNTTGLEAIDYRIVDAITDPPARADALHTEELIRLPRCFVAYSPPPDSGEVSPCPALRRAGFTFGSFSHPLKWNGGVIQAWAAILNSVPGSRLILHHGANSHKTAAVFDALRRGVLERFAAHGVDAGRISLIGYLDQAAHFALYREIDLCLDTFPYNGTTTVCEGLWMGVPPIALTGESHVARVAASILASMGLSHFAASSPGEYVELAVSVAGDVEGLAALRSNLRGRMSDSPVMDGHGLARAMEDAYRRIWRRWCSGKERAGRILEPAARPAVP
jgi:protein O-GlcNAc transferase